MKYLALFISALFFMSCASLSNLFKPHVTIERIKAPEHHLGAGNRLALARVSGPWKAKNYFRSELPAQIVSEDYYTFLDLEKDESSSKDIRIIIDTQGGKAEEIKSKEKINADYLVLIDVLEWDSDTETGEDVSEKEVEEKEFDAKSWSWKTVKKIKRIFTPWEKKTYTVSADFKVVDTKTRNVLLSENLTEKEGTGKIFSGNSDSKKNIFRSLAKKITGKFLHLITPYYIPIKIYFDDEDEDEKNKEAISHAKKERFDEAINLWLQGLKTSPNRSAFYYNVGVIYHATGQLDLAKKFYAQAISVQPKPLYEKASNELEDTLAEHAGLKNKPAIRTKHPKLKTFGW
jgi:hypothetical protein